MTLERLKVEDTMCTLTPHLKNILSVIIMTSEIWLLKIPNALHDHNDFEYFTFRITLCIPKSTPEQGWGNSNRF